MLNFHHTFALLLCLSAVSLGQPIGPGAPALASIHVGRDKACATTKTGELWCFGSNPRGVLGVEYDGTFYGNRYPVNPEYRDYSFWTEKVRPGFAVTKFLDDDVRVIDYQLDEYHSCILLSSGKVKCAGDPEYIGLEIGESTDYVADFVNDPFVDLGTDEPVSQLAVGSQHTCALIGDRVKCFGDVRGYNSDSSIDPFQTPNVVGDEEGEMGENLPYLDFGPGRTVKKIAANSQYTVALLDNGTASCFGGCFVMRERQAPHEGIIDFGERKAVDILAGRFSTCFVLDNQQMTCLGHNESGQLGLGTELPRVDIDDFDNKNITYVNFGTGRSVKMTTTGHSHTCAILDNDKVKCFGSNTGGQLSIPTSKAKSLGRRPEEMGDNLHYVDLGEGRTAKAISSSFGATCVLLDNDQMKCWGPSEEYVTYPLQGVDSAFYEDDPTEPKLIGYLMSEDLPYIYFVQPTKPLSLEHWLGIVGGLFVACALLAIFGLQWANGAKSTTANDVEYNGSDDELTVKSDNPMFV